MKKFRFDIILIIILVASLATWLIVWGISAKNVNKKAVISYGDEVIKEVNLNENQEITLYELSDGRKLNYEMLIVVSDGSIWVEENDCPNHDCIKAGKKSNVGDVIICLPNNIIIRIVEA